VTPAFLTPTYIEACRQAEHVQGWWTATWPDDSKPMTTQGSFDPNVDPNLRIYRDRYCPWALPPVGTGPQTNVRMGDFFVHVERPAEVLTVGPMALDGGSTWCWDSVVERKVPASPRATKSYLERYDTNDALVFLPRLDQLLWMLDVRTAENHARFFGGIGLTGDEPFPLAALLPGADAILAHRGCPRRTP